MNRLLMAAASARILLIASMSAGSSGAPASAVFNPKADPPIVSPALRFGDGRLFTPREIRVSGREIIVLDEKAPMAPADNEFVVFDRAGRWLKNFGRGGQGPGEFGQAHAFDLRGDVIAVLDSFKQCIHEFAASDKRFLKTIRYGSEQAFTTPHDFAALPSGGYVLCRPRGIRGDKTLFRVSPQGRIETSFLDVVPAFESEEDLMKNGNSSDPVRVRKQYAVLGYAEAGGGGIYYLPWLGNELLRLDLDGRVLERAVLPIPSLEKTVPVTKSVGSPTIERRLNYGLRCVGPSVWVLSRNEAGESLLFEYAAGRWIERLRAREALQDFDIADGRMYAVDQEAGAVLVYDLPSGR